MTYFTYCPIPAAGGRDCGNEPHPASGYGICVEHWRKIVKQWLEDVPSVHIVCVACDWLNMVDSVDLPMAFCNHCSAKLPTDENYIEAVRELFAREEAKAERGDAGVVYYMQFGNRIKIGFTTDLDARSKSVPNDEVLAAEPGSYELERVRHKEFAAHKVKSMKEWFTISPELALHIASVRAQHGEPFALTRNYKSRRWNDSTEVRERVMDQVRRRALDV